MSALRIAPTAIEPLAVFVSRVVTGRGATGLAPGDIVLKFQREDDDFWLDFSDLTFKVKGAVVTLTVALIEVDAVDNPGVYESAVALDFGAITNLGPNDNLLAIAAQTAGVRVQLPAPLEVKVGQWVSTIINTVTFIEELERAEVVVIPQGSPLGAPPREERKNAAGVVIAQGNAFEDASGTVPYRGNGLANRKRLS